MDSIDHEKIMFCLKTYSKLIYNEKVRLTKHYLAVNKWRVLTFVLFFITVFFELNTPQLPPSSMKVSIGYKYL